jgi:hypothetical protein
MVAFDFEREMVLLLEDVRSYAGRIHSALGLGLYGVASEGYSILVQLVDPLDHDEVVALVNDLGAADHRSGLIAKAWCQARGISSPVVEFETAFSSGEHIGEVFDLRRGKKTWGGLIAIHRDAALQAGPADRRLNGDAPLRMGSALKANNPIRLRMATRNELKLWLGAPAVADAMRSRRGEFVTSFSCADAARLERVTGMSLERIWGAIKKGDQGLVDRLGQIPSRKRAEMEKKGMFVSDHVDPQASLLGGVALVDRSTPALKREPRVDVVEQQGFLF